MKRSLLLARFVCLGFLICAAGALKASPSAAESAAHDAAARASKGYASSHHRYELPNVVLVGRDGRRVPMIEVVPRDAPVALTFIFTRCGSVCPVLSRTLAGLRKRMRAKADAVRVVSITIDPEHDTPEELQAYAEHYEATAGWQFYTGEPEQIDAILHAFDAFSQVREEHKPITFLRRAYGDDWTRLDGIMTSEYLAAELMRVLQR
jgi:protein SCO1/2